MATPTETRPLHAQGCRFCLRENGGSVSREHVFSEAWGNIELWNFALEAL
jgi:hypothetical protein